MAERSFPTPEQLDAMAEEGRRMITARRPNGPDPNSALIWFPPIHAAGLPVPRTAFVAYEPMSLWPICDGQEPLANFPIAKLKETAAQMGYPVFIRTDLASAKHDGPKSCWLQSIPPPVTLLCSHPVQSYAATRYNVCRQQLGQSKYHPLCRRVREIIVSQNTVFRQAGIPASRWRVPRNVG